MSVEAHDLRHGARANLFANGAELGAMHRDRVLEGSGFVSAPLLVGEPGLILLELQHDERGLADKTPRGLTFWRRMYDFMLTVEKSRLLIHASVSRNVTSVSQSTL